jgi:hypothetical protein
MKLAKLTSRFVATSTMSLLLVGGIALIGTQSRLCAQEQRDEAKPQQQEEPRPEAAKPAQDEPKAARPGDVKTPEQTEDRPAKNDEKPARQDNDKGAKDVQRGTTQTAKGPSGGGRIPDDKFRSSFGRQHTFKVQRPTIVAGGQPHFQYGGYSFGFVDAWPVGWSYSDDCYIDYIDGEYFLFDLAHPGVRIALIIV